MPTVPLSAGAAPSQSKPALSYVLITPARNEAKFIELTLQSVISQSHRPTRWIIVSDGSTDDTDSIVASYSAQHNWIELVTLPQRTERHFAAKAHAFHAGYLRLSDLSYDAVGSLDADISFDPDYFSFLLDRMHENPQLGLVGTPFAEDGVTYDFRFASVEHVSGACQLFRRECFEQIGGYKPLVSGGIDLVAVLSARMHGWQTRTFTERVCHHHRKQGSATRSGLAVIFNDGRKGYLLGSDPLWEFVRSVKRMNRRPYVIGGISLMAGYLWLAMRGVPHAVPADVIAFRRHDQRTRLRSIVRRLWGPSKRRA